MVTNKLFFKLLQAVAILLPVSALLVLFRLNTLGLMVIAAAFVCISVAVRIGTRDSELLVGKIREAARDR